MEKTLKDILEGLLDTLDPSKEVVTESVRTDISTKFIEAVNAAVSTETSKIDEAVAAKFDDLNTQINVLKESHEAEKQALIDEGVEALKSVDESYATMLEFAISQFDESAVSKLQECKDAFDSALDTEIEDLCESVEAIIDTKLEEANCDEDIVGLAKLEKLEKAFESMRDILFKDAVLEQKVTESIGSMKTDYDKLLSDNIVMSKKLNKIEVDSFLESETDGLKPALKDYLVERFENSKLVDIKENWDAALEDFNKIDEENRKLARSTAKNLNIDSKLDEDVDDDAVIDDVEGIDEHYQHAAQSYVRFF